MSTTPAPRILVRGDLRTIADLPADKAALTANVAASPYADEQGRQYVVTDEAVHSQRPVFAVRATGEWTCELVWAAGTVYRISAPGWMPDVMVYCDTLTLVDGFVAVDARDLIEPPGGDTPVEYVTLQTVIASIDGKVTTAVEEHRNASDPHPQYLTAARGDARYVQPGAIANLAPKVNPALVATAPAPVLTTVTTPALSAWTLTGSATYGTGSITVGPAAGGLSTDIPVTNGTVYQIDLTTSGSSGGDVTVTLGAASAIYPAAGITSVTVVATETGTRTLTISGATWSATITGVAVKALTRLSPAATIGVAEMRSWSSNTAVGTSAQYSLTTGSYNTAVGTSAQRSLTTGTYNTAAGTSAQYSLTTGYNNTAAGASAQYSLTTGTYNTAVGTSAQRSLTTGTYNTAVGTSAQRSPAGVTANASITGSRQTALGAETGQSVTTPLDDITTVGYRAVAGADFGTAIGSGASAAHLRSVALGSTTATTAPDQVMVGPRDVEISSATRGIILRSPSGTRYRVTVTNAGALTVSAV